MNKKLEEAYVLAALTLQIIIQSRVSQSDNHTISVCFQFHLPYDQKNFIQAILRGNGFNSRQFRLASENFTESTYF